MYARLYVKHALSTSATNTKKYVYLIVGSVSRVGLMPFPLTGYCVRRRHGKCFMSWGSSYTVAVDSLDSRSTLRTVEPSCISLGQGRPDGPSEGSMSTVFGSTAWKNRGPHRERDVLRLEYGYRGFEIAALRHDSTSCMRCDSPEDDKYTVSTSVGTRRWSHRSMDLIESAADPQQGS
jgi:hypothetical protein